MKGVVVDEAHKFREHHLSLLLLVAEHLDSHHFEISIIFMESFLIQVNITIGRRAFVGAGT